MDTEMSDSGNSGCASVIGYIFPALIIVGILLLLFSFIIDTTPTSSDAFTLTPVPATDIAESPTEEPTPEVVDDTACVACHTDQETLQAVAEEEEAPEVESEGEG